MDLTEASPVIAISTPNVPPTRRGRPLLPNVEVRIADDGEILVRGPNVMLGYWQDAAATADVIRDGWLHTGDLGELDADGFLSIRGRKKELIVLSTGKKVIPTRVESAAHRVAAHRTGGRLRRGPPRPCRAHRLIRLRFSKQRVPDAEPRSIRRGN